MDYTQLQVLIKKGGVVAYDKIFDSYYLIETNEWVEPVCRDEECKFCIDRPDKHAMPNVKLTSGLSAESEK